MTVGYACIATNDGGETSEQAHLTVNTPPVFLQKPTSKTVGKGSRVVFRCVVGGLPPPVIYWGKEQVSIGPQPKSTELIPPHSRIHLRFAERTAAVRTSDEWQVFRFGRWYVTDNGQPTGG